MKRSIEGRFGTYDRFVQAVAQNNHRIVRVEILSDMDVYDLEVDCPTTDDKSVNSGHNFVIWSGSDLTGSGVVVSNTRRAAKMVMLDVSHPDILVQQNGRPGFITCKSVSEKVAHDLFDTGKYTAEFNVPGNVYERVGFQNANNSVRVNDAFMKAVVADQEWQTRAVTSGEVVHTYRAKELFSEIARAAWYCGDPGVQFDTTINDWHTCPTSGRINGSNPCSEYMFLDDTACNLGSFNLMKFIGTQGEVFEAVGFAHACTIATTAMEILVDLAGYPSDEIGQNSHDFRPLGLGYANLGALLLVQGIAYDSDAGRDLAATITALMSGAAYAQSARIAQTVGPFPRYAENTEAMLAVMDKHATAIDGIEDDAGMLDTLRDEAEEQWQLARGLGAQHGYRNAQISVLAPTGTISFLMDCDTTGIEPVLAHVVYKKLVGGGTIRMPNRLVGRSLKHLGYTNGSYELVMQHLERTGDIIGSPLLEQHLPVFQTAIGENAISPEGHIRMMAAVQPFISGAISKTVNLPATATEEDVANVYLESWRLGLKAIALFRDGCKLSQPAGTKLDTAGRRVAAEPPPLGWGERKRLPDDRDSKTHRMKIGNAEGYLHVGLYPDGTPGEIFLTMAQEGSSLRGLADFAATALSIGLQHGVPLATFVEKMKHMRFDPSGFTGHPKIRMAESIPDYIARFLEDVYLKPLPATNSVSEETVSPEKLQEAVRTGFNGPPCTRCGNLTVRAGACYVCTSCATTTGCG